MWAYSRRCHRKLPLGMRRCESSWREIKHQHGAIYLPSRTTRNTQPCWRLRLWQGPKASSPEARCLHLAATFSIRNVAALPRWGGGGHVGFNDGVLNDSVSPLAKSTHFQRSEVQEMLDAEQVIDQAENRVWVQLILECGGEGGSRFFALQASPEYVIHVSVQTSVSIWFLFLSQSVCFYSFYIEKLSNLNKNN